MADQAENLRRLVQAQRDWKARADEPPASVPVEAGGGFRATWGPFRQAGSLLGLGGGRGRKAGRIAR